MLGFKSLQEQDFASLLGPKNYESIFCPFLRFVQFCWTLYFSVVLDPFFISLTLYSGGFGSWLVMKLSFVVSNYIAMCVILSFVQCILIMTVALFCVSPGTIDTSVVYVQLIMRHCARIRQIWRGTDYATNYLAQSEVLDWSVLISVSTSFHD